MRLGSSRGITVDVDTFVRFATKNGGRGFCSCRAGGGWKRRWWRLWQLYFERQGKKAWQYNDFARASTRDHVAWCRVVFWVEYVYFRSDRRRSLSLVLRALPKCRCHVCLFFRCKRLWLQQRQQGQLSFENGRGVCVFSFLRGVGDPTSKGVSEAFKTRLVVLWTEMYCRSALRYF